MARQITIPHTHTSVVTSYDSTDHSYYQIASGYPESNGLGDGTGTYAGFHLTRGSQAESYVYYGFDCSSIPDDATITSVSLSERASMSTQNTNQVATATLQLYAGTTAKGSATSFLNTTAQYFTVNGGSSWTVAEIKTCRLKAYCKRGSRNQNSQYTMRLFGGTLTVNYTTQGMAYTITASSEVDGETVSPATQELFENESAIVKINTSDLTNKKLTDNNTNVTSSLVYVPTDTGGTLDKYPASATTGGTGIISGMRYLTTIGHGVDNPSGTTQTDYTAQGGTTAIIYYHFDFSDLPDSASITSMTIQVRYKVGSTSYAQSVNTYNGTTSKGTSVTLNSTSETTTTISSPGTWTVAQLKDDPCVGLTLSYSGAIITGITWEVVYTANEPAYYKYTINNLVADHTVIWSVSASGDKLFLKSNGSWVKISKIYLKTNGTWVEQNMTYISDRDPDYIIRG